MLAGRPILTAAAMRAAEARVIDAGTSVEALMARVGAAVAEQVRRLAAGAEVLVLCGPGNNGGDGYVVASTLRRNGHPVRVVAHGEPRGAAAAAAQAGWGAAAESLTGAWAAPVMVDALFGIGLSRPLGAEVQRGLATIAGEARLRLAVDVPSGVGSDDGAALGACAMDVTFALGALKPAHVLYPAAEFCGAVRLLDIGVPADAPLRVASPPVIAEPDGGAHKFNRGMVAVIAGTMPGAGALAAAGAARGGAGYVLLLGSATDRVPHAIVRRRFDGHALADERIGAVVVGPGLGRDDAARAKLDAAIASAYPLVIDGDALHFLVGRSFADRAAPVILTPHAGEFAKLFGAGEGSRIDRARAAARSSGAILVLKGADTIVAAPDGRAEIHPNGSGWLSTAGTGDVLAGVIGARLAASGDGFAAASAGVWLHAVAAHLIGTSFIADDLAAALPQAIARCR